jgi:hypothetical protein
MPPSFGAVYGFYIISGFYMSLVIREEYQGHSGWALRFYSNRGARWSRDAAVRRA